MPPPLSPISVIIPLHNRADLAARCLAALGKWTTPREVIVVDDGSTDPGVERLRREHANALWLRNPRSQGFSAAVNRGLARSTGDPLLLLNSDAEVTELGDLALREAFAGESRRRSASRAAGPPPGAVAARLVYPDGSPQWSGGRFPTLTWLFALSSGLGRGSRQRLRQAPPSGFAGGPVDWAPAAALAISRSAWTAVGPFDENYRHYAQDLDYGSRLASAGQPVRVLADFVVIHHLGGSLAATPGDARDVLPSSGRPGDHAGQRLDLLWVDLLRWARKHRSASWARRARRRLLLGGRLRQILLLPRRSGGEAIAVATAIRALRAVG
jgi:GT2 family glycosyltransferase